MIVPLHPVATHCAYHVIAGEYREYHCFCPSRRNHLIGKEMRVNNTMEELDQMPPANEPKIKSTHYAILRRAFNEQAHPCYCNKRKDHDLTPRTPVMYPDGNIYGGPLKGHEKVRLSDRGFIKVTPTPVLLIKHETPVFAAVQREFNAKVAGKIKAEEQANSLSLDD